MGRRGKKKLHPKRPTCIKTSNPTSSGSSSAPPPPWIELPRDVTENILSRLGQVAILQAAQKVCSTWRSVCKEPSLWRVIDIQGSGDDGMCRHAVDLSQGELIDISIDGFGTDDLLHYISERSSHLKRLRLEYCDHVSGQGLTASIKNFPELEELHLFFMSRITAEHVEGISASCRNLKSFTFNRRSYRFEPMKIDDRCALTISRNMPNLQHLCLMGNQMSNEGLKAILNGCPNLESLDISKCYSVDLQGDFGKICSERIKSLKRPFDSYGWDDMLYDRLDNDWDDLIYDHEDYGYDSSDYDNYDEYDPFPHFI